MELRHLRYFVAVAEEEHITRAAERLGIQQPPLSHQIKALETELGVRLFRRVPRGVELTDAGNSLLEDAYAILESVERATARAQETSRGMRGSIVVGFTTSLPFHRFVPEVIRKFRIAYPLVSVSLEEGGTIEMADAIQANRMDAAFIRTEIGDTSGMAVHPLLEEPMLVAMPTSHQLAKKGENRKTVSLVELSSDPFVLYRRHSAPGLHDAIIQACRSAGFVPEIVQEAPRITSTLSFVSAGLGVSIVPESLGNLGMPGVVFRPLKRGTELKAPIQLACKAVTQSQSVSNFVALIRREAKAHR